jgi:hypothetical protein
MMEIRLKSRPPYPHLMAASLLPMLSEYVPGLLSYCRLQKLVKSMIVVFDEKLRLLTLDTFVNLQVLPFGSWI